ncbi:MAG: FAD-binding oxidoreductase, partial [Saprospiraceae bacterium]|nr:FAD-binding oxidoreductase [Saprospiraceae bacterium]
RYFPAYKQERAFQELSDEKNLKTKLREKVWYGFRPLSADGLPYIGFGKKSSNLILATGHAMLGISMGAGTGKLVAELAAGEKTSIPAKAFDPGRY